MIGIAGGRIAESAMNNNNNNDKRLLLLVRSFLFNAVKNGQVWLAGWHGWERSSNGLENNRRYFLFHFLFDFI